MFVWEQGISVVVPIKNSDVLQSHSLCEFSVYQQLVAACFKF